MLVCGYLFSNKPDHYSVMHFNAHAEHVFSASDDDYDDDDDEQVVFLNAHHHHSHHHTHKYRVSKQFSFKTIQITPAATPVFVATEVIEHAMPINESYYFLFCKEINPPPPKTC